jgi:hypothetical protein
VLLDDCHACIDAIRGAFVINLPRTEQLYSQLLELFAPALEGQGAGRFADVRNRSRDVTMPIPYWVWQERQAEVVSLISKQTQRDP